MAHGFSLTRHDGLPPYAERLAAAGAAVLVFDHRYLGDSGGWLVPRALADQLGRHNLVAVTAQPGGHAAMTLPGEADGFYASVPEGSPWRNEISPAIFLTVGLHRPVAHARRLRMPLWVGLGDADVSVSRKAVQRLAERAPRGELHRYPYDHFGAFLGEGPALVAHDQVDFLRRNSLLGG